MTYSRSIHWFLFALGLMAGCSGTDTHVTGTVLKADGTPLVDATVAARCMATGKSFFGTTDQDGHYVLANEAIPSGLMPGEYQVSLAENLEVDGRFLPPTIPQKYSTYTTSGLSFDLGPNETKIFDIKIEAMQRYKGSRR